MLDISHLFTQYPTADIQVFVGNKVTIAEAFVWQKPRGRTMCQLLLVSAGGDGGQGAIGAANAAAGGGGGGSGAQLVMRFPLWAVPDTLWLNLQGTQADVSLTPVWTVDYNRFAFCFAASNGGNASGATAGTAGGGPIATTSGSMPQGWQWVVSNLAGQAGQAGGAAGMGTFTQPTTGLIVTGGTGGAGVSSGSNVGGPIGASGIFPIHPGGDFAANSTLPPGNGLGGYQPVPNMLKLYGGTGGASTTSTATGAGLVQASGGNGAPGCGGGGSGGALTGSTPGVPGKGGPSFAIFTCW